MAERCYACERPLRAHTPHEAWTSDGQMVWVGLNCMRLITQAGAAGYQPPLGGPKLYKEKPHADAS